jgi:hypothetical protein
MARLASYGFDSFGPELNLHGDPMNFRNGILLGAAALVLVAPGSLQAQSSTACVVPGTGNLYAVGAAGLPAECRAGHSAFVLGGGGSLTFPYSSTGSTAGPMFLLRNEGTGAAARFEGVGGHALRAIGFGGAPSIRAENEADGTAIHASNNSTGPATIHAENAGTGAAGFFRNSGGNNALWATSNSTHASAMFENTATTEGSYALWARSFGNNSTAHFRNEGPGSALSAHASSVNNTVHFNNNSTTTGGALGLNSAGTWSTLFAHNSGTGGAIGGQAAGGVTANFNNTGTGEAGALGLRSEGQWSTMWARNEGTAGGSAAHFFSRATHATIGVDNEGAGYAAHFNSQGNAATIFANNTHTHGSAIAGQSNGEYTTGSLTNNGVGGALYGQSQGTHPTANFRNNGAGGALNASTNAPGTSVYFENQNTGEATALSIRGHGVWSAGFFRNDNGDAIGTQGTISINADRADRSTANIANHGTGTALHLHTNGGTGQALSTFGNAHIGGNLHVAGNYSATGTKNAVVETSSGQRLMYSEEATEVWFTDYGFGKLRNGEVWIELDRLYTETANLNEPYHVFLQTYGPAELYVTDRTPTGFRVRVSKGDATSEFSYRIVARRMNFENDRLELAGARGGN